MNSDCYGKGYTFAFLLSIGVLVNIHLHSRKAVKQILLPRIKKLTVYIES